jgi:aspartyl-tRNA synthetase
MDWRRRVYCGSLTLRDEGRDVLLMGWVDAVRDHGNLLFIHLRDVKGIVQVVFDPRVGRQEICDRSASLKEEDVIQVEGRVALREKGTENPNLKTGGIEVFAERFTLLSTSRALPFPISEKGMVFGEETRANPVKVEEDLRLRYRYLDLRRPSVQGLFLRRYEIIKSLRDSLHEAGFVEIETPFLTKSTPEGARDYLVPSRVHRGKFYALPQSPQLFKQLLMMGGMDRYFQIARCFRDEDLRPNRQPEFTQLDMEASFIDEEFLYELVEDLTVRIFALGEILLTRPFPRMTYDEAMDRYGTDRPDVRFPLTFKDITDIAGCSRYAIFRQIAQGGGCIKGFALKGQAKALSKNVLQNEYALSVVPSLGGKGMTWMKVTNGTLESNIVQFFSQGERESFIDRFGAGEGDVLVMVGDDSRSLVNDILGKLRLHMAEKLHLIPEGVFRPLWVTDFPLFEMKDGHPSAQHHPFTMPDRLDFDPFDLKDLMKLKSRAYDLVMNGEELGGGSIRIHRMDIQRKIFQALGLTSEEVETKFGFFLRALEYGAPPHGGLALGLDRVISMILGTASIRDVIAFPKNRKAACPLTDAPSFVEEAHRAELGLTLGEEIGEEGQPTPTTPKTSRGFVGISREEVEHVAKLARLSFTGPEAESCAHDLSAILGYVETLEGLDTSQVDPTSRLLELSNVWEEDDPAPWPESEEILRNAPDRKELYFKVPKILEG